MKAKKIITELLSKSGIKVNGKMPWDIQIHNEKVYQRILSEKELGLGESYMDGWWDCASIDEFINKILIANNQNLKNIGWKNIPFILSTRIFNKQTKSRAYQVGEQHYNIGNDLYKAMLDTRLNYTCAYWKNADNLEQAQEAKLDLICKKIGMKANMTILEIGCGWGAFAKYAAEKYDAKVLGIGISKEQIKFCKKLCKGLPIEIRLQDYREVYGKYDVVLSIGVLEHIGYKNYRTYMKVTERCLKDDGIAFIQTIGDNISFTYANKWMNKYIFPNGMLPSMKQIAKSIEGIFMVEDWHNFGPDYDKTLMAWYQNFNKAWQSQLKDKYGDRFYRMWCFYLLTCAGAFRSRKQHLWQIVLTKIGRKQPDCRIS